MEVLTRITRPAGQVRADSIRGQDCALFDDHEVFDGDEFALSSRKRNRERPNELGSRFIMYCANGKSVDIR
jgi:hypothetical protein